ncbi:MAG: polyphosphate kinase 1 [Spirochaetales bacterium]|nr:polyphosphate kinase 1 [Spirochaetales bacterium]
MTVIKHRKSLDYYRPKETSWLAFNQRLLQEAEDASVPLIERLRFLGIFSSNLDEFYRVRVATLSRLSKIGKRAVRILGYDPKKVLQQVNKTVIMQQKQFDCIYDSIKKELDNEHVHIISEMDLTEEQGHFVHSYFQKKIRPKLIPIMIDQINEFPDLRDQFIYLAVVLHKETPGSLTKDKAKYALIEVPTDQISRFLVLPSHDQENYIMLIDDVIRFGLKDIFAMFDYSGFDAYTIKVTRDAELDIIEDDLSQSEIKKVSKSLKQRKEGDPVRLIYDQSIPEEFLQFIRKNLQLSSFDTTISGSRYHNFKDFISFPVLGKTKLVYPPLKFLSHRDIKRNSIILKTIAQKDILLHFPFQSFHYFIDLLREASIDPDVTSIKLTIYRAAKNSSVINALINAVKNGKQVVVVIELRARFDEAANIKWANLMQEEGVKVIYGVQGLKVHAKLCLITRKENKLVEYCCIGTGNFNEATAKIYGDITLMTADKRITKEVSRIFDFFEANYDISQFKHLIVSPFNMRKKIIKFIQKETRNAAQGKAASIVIKLNNLVDSEIIQHLYEASRAGVSVRLMIRGMFSLIPGIEDMSENIKAKTIIDKFLEHTRILYFYDEGNHRIFISSADWMRRNMDRRVEVCCPIYDENLKKELLEYLEMQWADNVKSRHLDKDLSNEYAANDKPKSHFQEDFYAYLKEKHGISDMI